MVFSIAADSFPPIICSNHSPSFAFPIYYYHNNDLKGRKPMEKTTNAMTNSCNFSGIRPAIADLPYPEIRVQEQNLSYAALLSNDYCGAVSELSAITQYINNENRISATHCPLAKTFLGIAMAEMMHLQKLGELIRLLGGNVDFAAKQPNGKSRMWTPAFLTLPDQTRNMLLSDIEAEKAAIRQYQMHRKAIKDHYVDAVLARIIQDEEYHIMLLNALLS